MGAKKQYNGLDAVKFVLSILVAMRHIIQIFFTAESRAHMWIGAWLSNLAVPTFFIISGFFLFQKVEAGKPDFDCKAAIRRHSIKVLRMYLIWSALYLPIDWYNWSHGEAGVWEGIGSYLHAFLFSSTTVQLWYLPALLVSCLLVWSGYTRGLKIWQLLLVGGCLYTVGVIGDNWYLNEMLPHPMYEKLMVYNRYFLTMRNGLFYGVLYVAIGLWFAKHPVRKDRMPLSLWFSAAGAVFFIGVMYQEVLHFHNTNMLFSAVPAVVCLFMAAAAVEWKDRKLYPRLRMMSEWIYLAHVYFFYFFAWTLPWNPVPANNKTVMAMIMGAVLIFAWAMTRLSERKYFRWLKFMV